jgi:hypothetical protein
MRSGTSRLASFAPAPIRVNDQPIDGSASAARDDAEPAAKPQGRRGHRPVHYRNEKVASDSDGKDTSDAHEAKLPAVDAPERSGRVCEAAIDGNPGPVALPECLEESCDADEPKGRSHRLPDLRADAPSDIHDGRPG